MKQYSFTWAFKMVFKLHHKYSRAFSMLQNVAKITDREIAGRFMEEKIDWPRYKKFLRELDKLLHGCVVVSDEKVYERWLDIAKPVDEVLQEGLL